MTAASYVVRCQGGVPRTYTTVHAAARALLRSDGPTEAVSVMLAGGLVERGLTQAELVGLGHAVRDAREAREAWVALEAENNLLASRQVSSRS
jgi:Arc/MetJ family transcription regulator